MRGRSIFLIRMFAVILAAGLAILIFVKSQDENLPKQVDIRPLRIQEFVQQTFIHGVPYLQVIRYDPDTTTPVLLELLRNADYRIARSQIATTLGMLGDRRAIAPLMQLAQEEQGNSALSRADYNAKIAAIGALGFALNREMDTRAFEYLTGLASMNPENTNAMKWASPYQESVEDRDVEVARIAIIALSLSGREEAKAFLDSLRVQNLALISSSETQTTLNSTVDDSLITLRAIKQGGNDGLKNYFRDGIH